MKLRFYHLVLLILIAAGAQPAYSAYWQWSKTAATNSGADPSINWAEGMSPSSVNDSARAMMARSAEYRDDISGLLATAGGPTAYTVTTNQGLASTPNDGQLLSFTINATNGAAATLQADGGTVYPIQSAAGVAVASATLISGSPYSVKFSTANSAWMLKGFYASPTNVALGMMVPFTLTTVPNSNFVFPAGQCLSTTTYAAYWTALGSPASGSCPGGQFAIIDLSGRVPAGLDTMPGFAAKNRLTASGTGCGTAMTTVGAICANGVQESTVTLAQLPTNIASSGTSQVAPGSGLAVPVTSSGTSTTTNDNSGVFYYPGSTSGYNYLLAVNGTASVVSTNTSGNLRPQIQPTIGVTYLLRVL